MQIGNSMFTATDWASMHREKMNSAGKTVFGPVTGAGQDIEDTEERTSGELSSAEAFERTRGGRLSERLNGTKKAPYSYLADESNMITYNGVTFYCDNEKRQLCLGDVSDKKKCITVGLSGGGSLVVNRDNIGDLSKAIGMFSPEDANRIMRAIAQDAMCQRKLHELDEDENSIGEAEETEETEQTEETEDTDGGGETNSKRDED